MNDIYVNRYINGKEISKFYWCNLGNILEDKGITERDLYNILSDYFTLERIHEFCVGNPEKIDIREITILCSELDCNIQDLYFESNIPPYICTGNKEIGEWFIYGDDYCGNIINTYNSKYGITVFPIDKEKSNGDIWFQLYSKKSNKFCRLSIFKPSVVGAFDEKLILNKDMIKEIIELLSKEGYNYGDYINISLWEFILHEINDIHCWEDDSEESLPYDLNMPNYNKLF